MLSNRNRNSNSKFGGKGSNRIGTMTPLGAVPKEKKAPKVSVPKPVNLPSMKKEHAGNDPTTQLVGGGGGIHGWQKDGSHDPNSGGMVSGAHHHHNKCVPQLQPYALGAEHRPHHSADMFV